MRIEQLRYIADIAETGSLTATAQRQFVTQQAISKTIKQLEKELDATLLIRTRTGVSFTEIGKELVDFAQKVLKEEAAFLKHVAQLKHTERTMAHNDLYIATTSSISNLLLPILISNPKIQEHNVSIHFNNGNNYVDVIDQVHTKKSDLGLITVKVSELEQIMEQYQKSLECSLLIRDKLIALMDRRYYTGEVMKLTDTMMEEHKVWTTYNLHLDGHYRDVEKNIDKKINIISSADADFHRDMMEKVGAITLMSVTSFHQHFNNKRYVALTVNTDNYDLTLQHVAIYRKSSANRMEPLVNLLRREMFLDGKKNG